jgi:translocation and assembly module TamA
VTLDAPGAGEELAERLTAASSIIESQARGLDGVQELLAASLADYRTMVQVLYDAGHFSPVVNIRLDGREAASIQPLNPPKAISNIEIRVQPGPKFTFGQAVVAPLPDASVSLPEEFATGQTATTGAMRAATRSGIRSWREAGHAKVSIGSRTITADHLKARLDADIRLAPGRQLRFGKLTIEGETDVREEAVRAIAGFPAGEQFHPDRIDRVGTRLRRTGAFSAVTLREAQEANPDGTLDVTATLEDLPKRRLTFGAEISSSDGLEITGTWMHRNLFGNAEKLRLETRLSGIGGGTDIDGRVALRLDRPATLGPDDNTFYLLEAERLDEEHYQALRGLGAIGVRRVFSDRLLGEASIGFESVLAEDVFGKRRFKYITGQIRAEYERRNNRVSATDGYYIDARAIPFIGVDGSKTGVQFRFDGRGYQRIGGNHDYVLAARVQLGSVAGPSLNEVSPTYLFFSGGAGSVRGQEYQSLGVPAGGGTAGGRGYLALSGELRGRVSEKITLVGFYDVGFIDSDSLVSSDSSRHSGAGIGVRYDVAGIGPIRLDLAYPVEGGTDDGLQFYIGIGQAF